MIGLIFQKGLMLIKQICWKYAVFVTTGILKILVLSVKVLSFGIAYVKGSFYRIHFWYMSKDDAINITNGSNLVDEMDIL